MPNNNLAPQHALTNYPQIVDGFCYSQIFGTRPLLKGMSWYWSCLESPEMEALRLAADSYRPRQWTIPKNFIDLNNPNGENILPGKTVFYEFQVKPGSWLWGMQFAVFDNDHIGDNTAQQVYSVVIRQGSELPMEERPMVCSAIFSGSPIDPLNTQKPPVNLPSKPRLILEPSQLHVEISNDQTAVQDEFLPSVQLLLMFAEPRA